MIINFTLMLLLFQLVSSEQTAIKLRRVDMRQLARYRSTKAINNLADGALYMRESLLAEDNLVKCPGYGHLFWILKRPTKTVRIINQSIVEALAVVVNSERSIYQKLLEGRLNLLATYFKETSEALESDLSGQVARNAYLDLIECMSWLMNFSETSTASREQLERFLDEPKRASRVADLNRFKRVPAGPVEDRGRDVPKGLVARLANRIDQTERARPNAADIAFAQELIEDLEDEETRRTRLSLEGLSFDEADKTEERKNDNEQVEDKKEMEGEEVPTSKVVAPQIELIVPDGSEMKEKEDEDEEGELNEFGQAQLEFLRFVRMRLEPGHGRMPKLSIQLAYDFINQWEDLVEFVQSSSSVGSPITEGARNFAEDPRSQVQVKRVRAALSKLQEIVAILPSLKEHNLKSIAELGDQLHLMGHLLTEIDPALDTDDLWRIYEIWRARHHEYTTIQGFIESDSW